MKTSRSGNLAPLKRIEAPGDRAERLVQQASRKERPLRTHLAKQLLGACADYQALKPGEYAAKRPELAQAAVQDAVKARATDIHISPAVDEVRVRFRIDGTICDVAALTAEQGRCLTNQFKALANLDPVARFTPKDSHAHFALDGA